MENELNRNFEFSDDDSSLKSLEEFFGKEVSNNLTPQEMIIISLSLNYVGHVLNLYNSYSNIAVFDIKAFTEKHPEYANVDFNHLEKLDEDTIESIKNIFNSEAEMSGSEEFNKGSILMENIIQVILTISVKLYDNYTKEYSKKSPQDTEQFFTMLDNCLQNSLTLLKAFFTQSF